MATTPKAARAVQVPGEPVADAQAPIEPVEPVADVVDEPAADDVGEPNAAADVNAEVAALRQQLEDERIARIEAEQRAAQAEASASAGRVVHAEPEQAQPVKPGTTAKLTTAGWVVPATYGSPIKAA